MTDKEKLDLINSMEIIGASSNGMEIEYIVVEDNEVNRNTLRKIGATEEDIYPDSGTLDITAVGLTYADYFCARDKKFLLFGGKRTSFENWKILREDMECAVEEGVDSGFNNTPDIANGGKYIAYKYVLDKMNQLEKMDGVHYSKTMD